MRGLSGEIGKTENTYTSWEALPRRSDLAECLVASKERWSRM
jgi:hypothetical protein